jgi:hypothetical protein
MAYPALHRQSEKLEEFPADVESAGHPMGVMVLAGQYALAGHGVLIPPVQKNPGRHISHL